MLRSGWFDILAPAGGDTAEIYASFAEPGEESRAATHGDAIVPLADMAAIRVAGADAESFLAAQLTSDIGALGAQRTQLGAWCSAQGRVLVLVRVIRLPEEFLLLLPAEIAEATVTRLRMYVLRARVTLEVSDLLAAGISGADAMADLSSVMDFQEDADQVVFADGLTALRVRDRRKRAVVLGASEAVASLWQRLEKHARRVGYHAWRLLDIEAALPQVYGATQNRFLPQMLNLDLLGGLSFQKGCYPGQEVIARLKYRGQLKQRLLIARSDPIEPVAIGSRLVTAGDEAAAGEVVMTARHPDGGCAMSVVAQMNLLDSRRVHLYDPSGPAVRLTPPPYPIA